SDVWWRPVSFYISVRSCSVSRPGASSTSFGCRASLPFDPFHVEIPQAPRHDERRDEDDAEGVVAEPRRQREGCERPPQDACERDPQGGARLTVEVAQTAWPRG